MRLLTKEEACRELRMSLSTLNRRIAAGEVAVRRVPRGRRHRVYVMMDDGLPSNDETPQSALAVAQESIRGLEAQVDWLQGQLEFEQRRNADLGAELRAAQARHRPRWRFWRRSSDKRALTGPAGRGMMDSKTI